MRGWFCRRCHQPMRANGYGWFVHVITTKAWTCECQHAYYAEQE